MLMRVNSNKIEIRLADGSVRILRKGEKVERELMDPFCAALIDTYEDWQSDPRAGGKLAADMKKEGRDAHGRFMHVTEEPDWYKRTKIPAWEPVK